MATGGRLGLATLLLAGLLAPPGLVRASGPAIAAARARLSQLNHQEAALAEHVAANRGELARLLGALELYGRDPPPALLVSPRDAKGAVRAAILIRAMTPVLEARARALSDQVRSLSVTRRQVAAASGELFAAESAVADRGRRLEGVAEDADLLAPVGRAAAPRGAAPASLLQPVAGEVAVGFHGRLPDGAPSRGLSIRAAPGAAVVSPAAALVDYAGPLDGWGEVIILRGAGGYHMVLSGMGKVEVAAGQAVLAAETVGHMASGGGSAPELYFEVRVGEAPTDPARLMARADRSAGR
ncbi:MAG TPA: peptidoglycan DD-metalloendopeptidase family protein [Caulobacteraceae bacterium]|nr:peptidoglycan DD-metalloendopeptidase family protein [Caulobacteraceae bacterium]